MIKKYSEQIRKKKEHKNTKKVTVINIITNRNKYIKLKNCINIYIEKEDKTNEYLKDILKVDKLEYIAG